MVTILLRFLAHAPLSEHVPQLKYRRTEVNCNIYRHPAFSINSQDAVWIGLMAHLSLA